MSLIGMTVQTPEGCFLNLQTRKPASTAVAVWKELQLLASSETCSWKDSSVEPHLVADVYARPQFCISTSVCPLQMYYQVGLPRKDNFAVDYALLDLVEQMAYEPFYDQLR